MKKLFTVLIAFAVIFGFSGCPTEPEKETTTLKIINQSSYELSGVAYSTVGFGDLSVGGEAAKAVSADTLPVYFYLKISDIRIHCKTSELITCDAGAATVQAITNNTIVTAVDSGQSGTLKTVHDNIVATNIGGTGPGGGIIFFAQGGRYKECSGYLGEDTWYNAVTTAKAFEGGGFTDWHLPDKDELDLMYTNLHKKGLGNFQNDWYWSSSAYDDNYAWYLDFGGYGFQDTEDKNTFSLYVRAVRDF